MAQIGTDIIFAKKVLEAGKPVAIPTETVYGLAANALDEKAVSRVFEVKNRPSFDPLIVHLSNKGKLDELCSHVPDNFYRLYEAFCPGPLTFIMPKSKKVPGLVTAGNPTVGLRFPDHRLTLDLLGSLDFPLAAPSANPFGYVSPTSAQHVEKQLGGKIDYILDGGPCKVGLESTIIDLSTDSMAILRLGGLSLEEIESVVGKVHRVKTSTSNPKAPGMLSSHYSPGKKIVFGDMEDNYRIFKGQKLGSITFFRTVNCIPAEHQWVLSPGGDLREAASKLFKSLRETDDTDLDVILAERFPDEGLGRAINDRLMRAYAK
ncbi:MAG TPA: threonylcarbamoyl-AMP synthase [Cryomorphaceae bacterium]|nr:threonylcarbamoyl-AMP synthase [Cryomorphaceae bacterium]